MNQQEMSEYRIKKEVLTEYAMEVIAKALRLSQEEEENIFLRALLEELQEAQEKIYSRECETLEQVKMLTAQFEFANLILKKGGALCES